MSENWGNPPVLRPATEADRDLLYRIYASTRDEELAATDWDDAQKSAFLQMQFDAQHRYYSEKYRGAQFQVIERDQIPVGRLYLIRWPDEIRIIDIALLPEYRGLGIGSQLVRNILAEADQAGVPVTIHVERFNRALSLYRRLDFRQVEDKGVYLLLQFTPASRTGQQSAPKLDELTIADFSEHVGQVFRVEIAGAGPISLELASVTGVSPSSSPNPKRRQPFSLLFLGPPSDHYLPQHTYRLEHAQIGALDIFLVPIGPLDQRMQYEAIFT